MISSFDLFHFSMDTRTIIVFGSTCARNQDSRTLCNYLLGVNTERELGQTHPKIKLIRTDLELLL